MIPMLLSLFVMEKKARTLICFILTGCTVCLFVSELNGLLYLMLKKNMLFFCTMVSPVTEEVLKAIPVLFYAFFFSDKRKELVQVSFALGLGFAIMENMNMPDTDTIMLSFPSIRKGIAHRVVNIPSSVRL